MKKLLSSLFLMLLVTSAFAQGIELGNTTGYIDCSNGITTYRTARDNDDSSPYIYATYALDSSGKPETLIGLYATNGFNANIGYQVVEGTKRIAKGSIPSSCTLVNLPTSIRYIPDGEFSEKTISMYGSSTSAKAIELTPDEAAEEIARYNIQGQQIGNEEKGVQIIHYSDGTSKKVLKK